MPPVVSAVEGGFTPVSRKKRKRSIRVVGVYVTAGHSLASKESSLMDLSQYGSIFGNRGKIENDVHGFFMKTFSALMFHAQLVMEGLELWQKNSEFFVQKSVIS